MTIKGWKWLKTAINTGNLWTTALQPMDDDDDGTNMSEPCTIYNGRTLARNWSRPYGSAVHGHCLLQSNPALQTPAKYRHPYITDSFIYPNERKLMYFL